MKCFFYHSLLCLLQCDFHLYHFTNIIKIINSIHLAKFNIFLTLLYLTPFIFNSPNRGPLLLDTYFPFGFWNTTTSYLIGHFTISFVGSFSLIIILPWSCSSLSLRLFVFIYTVPTWTQSVLNFNYHLYAINSHFYL